MRRNTQRPLFQHRHYVKIAEIIASMPESHRDYAAYLFAQRLVGTNPNYDSGRFERAANGKPVNGRDRAS